jgi:hypothetical protein
VIENYAEEIKSYYVSDAQDDERAQRIAVVYVLEVK